MRFLIYIQLVFLCLFVYPLGVIGDEIALNDGTILKGVFEKLRESVVSFDMQESQEVSVDWKNIKSMATQDVVYIQLKDGRRLSGKMSLNEEQNAHIELYILPGQDPIALIGVEKDDIRTIQKSPFLDSYSTWSGSLAIGGEYSTGNVSKREIDTLFNATMKNYYLDTLTNQMDFEIEENFLKNYKTIVDNDGHEKVTFMHFWTPDWSWYALEQIGYNKPELLSLRTEFELGVGYRIFNYEKFKVTILNGFGRIDSQYDSNPRSSDGFFAYVPGFFLWAQISALHFTSQSYLKYDVGNFSNYLGYSLNRLFIPLSKKYLFEVRYEFDYNSNPPPNLGRVVKKLDTKATLNLVYVFNVD